MPSRGLPCRLLASTADLSGSEEQTTHLLLCFPQQKKKSKKERELEKQKAEKELSRIEEALMDPGRQPESAEDFDRLVLSSPSSSLLWLQYMAFHLQATEIEKARAVAERALKTISFRSRPRRPALGPVFPQGGPCFLHRPAAVGAAATRARGFTGFLSEAGRDIDLLIYISWSSSLRELGSHFHESLHCRCPTWRKVEEEKLASPHTWVKILV